MLYYFLHQKNSQLHHYKLRTKFFQQMFCIYNSTNRTHDLNIPLSHLYKFFRATPTPTTLIWSYLISTVTQNLLR